MKFFYVWKGADGVRREGEANAASRDEVFAGLRAKGIRPIKVWAADGSKANGEEQGTWLKRRGGGWLLAVAVGLAGVAASIRYSTTSSRQPTLSVGLLDGDQEVRRQVIGDVAIIEKGIADGWADVFPREGERFLASFAIPGAGAGVKSVGEGELSRALERRFPPQKGDSLETRQIKAMVEGMKDEARAYLKAGGALKGYGERLVERQEAERRIYAAAKEDLKRARERMDEPRFMEYWEQRNEELRNLGIKTIGFE